MKNPIDTLKGIAAGRITAIVLSKASKGDFGPQVKWAYWHLRGLKTWTFAIFAFAVGAIEAGQRSGLCELLAGVFGWVDCGAWLDSVQWAMAMASAAFLYLGQVDGALFEDAPAASRR